jgi:hypothetical protein
MISLIIPALSIARDNDQQNSHDMLFQQFMQPITIDHQGFDTFFKKTFNHPLYGQEFLPASFMHLGDLLKYTSCVTDQETYAATIIDLFHQRSKESLWVNPYAFSEMLDMLAHELKPMVTAARSVTKVEQIKKEIYDALVTNFDEFKKNPDDTINTLAHTLCAIVPSTNPNFIMVQNNIVRFLEQGLSKLVWAPSEQLDTWESCKVIAYQLASLCQDGLISDKHTLNQLYWSLIYRYCYFLKTSASELSIDILHAIGQELSQHKVIPFTMSENETFLQTKQEQLEQALLEAEVVKQTTQIGFINHNSLNNR